MGIGPLLHEAMQRMDQAGGAAAAALAMTSLGAGDGDRLPVIVSGCVDAAATGEPWADYRRRSESVLGPLADEIQKVFGAPARTLLVGSAIQTWLTPDQVAHLAARQGILRVELDPLLHVASMDDALVDIQAPAFRLRHPAGDGSGVSVAVLDSGVDKAHPFLSLAASASTCAESDDVPGDHGTHCAGSVASRDQVFGGVAPGVNLINVKVLHADGSGRHGDIARGVDEALDRGADVLSMSLGFNHLPRWSDGGHGWSCPTGNCPLCTAVDNASRLDNRVVVVAAGNEHQRADALRGYGWGGSFDTELGCPGQAREAITVGAVTKRTYLPAGFSSRGPTSYGATKPDLCAPGVNVTSTVPVPRLPNGTPDPAAPRSVLFRRMSGTSMATPIVAGAAALAIQLLRAKGVAITPGSVKAWLLQFATTALPGPATAVGAGRLDIGRI